MISNRLKKNLLVAAIACTPVLGWPQFLVNQSFRNSTAPGWTLNGTAQLTAANPPGYDAEGNGWLRLTENRISQVGSSSYTGDTFSASDGVVVDFDYVIWMRKPVNGSSGDGLSFYLYDASKDMNGAIPGDGLGYCGGAGGYLGIGLDVFGNFTPGCGNSGGPPTPNSIVVRGPVSLSNVYVAGVPVPALNNPNARTRPVYRSARIFLTPTGDASSPFLISVEDGPAGAPIPIITNQAFPHAAPDQLSIGFGGSTGAATQVQEVRLNKVAATADVQVENTLMTPATRRIGDPVSYILKVKNNIFPNSILSAEIDDPANAPLLNDHMPELTDKTWTCTASGAGTTCPAASGNGDIANLGNYTMGQSGELTFVLEGRLDAAAACDSTIGNIATLNFADAAGFSDQDLTNNAAMSASFVVDCSEPPITNPPPKPIPTLGAWGLGLLSLGLVSWGAASQRRAGRPR